MRWMGATYLMAVLLLVTAGCDRERPLPPNEALHRAIQQRSITRVRAAIGNGADVNARDRPGWTPLHMAVHDEIERIAELLLACGADVNAVAGGRTPLYRAAARGQLGMAKLLLAYGADVDGSPRGVEAEATPLTACYGVDVMKLLIAHGANVNARGHAGDTALHHVVSYHYGFCMEAVRLLLRNGADPNIRNDAGQTPAMVALETNVIEEATRLLMEAGSDVATIHLAAFVGDCEKVRQFMEDGEDVDSPLRDKRTPLHIAAQEGQAEVVALLIARGAGVNVRGDRDYTPLGAAVASGCGEAVTALIAAGADVNNTHGWENATALHVAAQYGYKDIVESLIAAGADVDARDNDECRPVDYAAYGLHEDVIDLLIAHGANISAKDSTGETILHGIILVSYGGQYWHYVRGTERDLYRDVDSPSDEQIAESVHPHFAGTVKCLARHGAQIDANDGSGCTPLHYAAFCDRPRIAEVLLDLGARIDAADHKGQTPLHHAASDGHAGIIELLVSRGADVNVKDQQGRTPLNVLRWREDARLEELLTPTDKASAPAP